VAAHIKRTVQELAAHRAQLVQELEAINREIAQRAGDTDDAPAAEDKPAEDKAAVSPGAEDKPAAKKTAAANKK